MGQISSSKTRLYHHIQIHQTTVEKRKPLSFIRCQQIQFFALEVRKVRVISKLRHNQTSLSWGKSLRQWRISSLLKEQWGQEASMVKFLFPSNNSREGAMKNKPHHSHFFMDLNLPQPLEVIMRSQRGEMVILGNQPFISRWWSESTITWVAPNTPLRQIGGQSRLFRGSP